MYFVLHERWGVSKAMVDFMAYKQGLDPRHLGHGAASQPLETCKRGDADNSNGISLGYVEPTKLETS